MATIKELQATYDRLLKDEAANPDDLRAELENLWAAGAEELAKALDKDPESDESSELVTLIEHAVDLLKSLEYEGTPEAD